jgi:hypothetical protein
MLGQNTEIDYHFVCERVAHKMLYVQIISSEDQIVDGFTKALPIRKNVEFCYSLNLEL